MDKVEELLRSRKWAKDCLRTNIAQPEQIISRGKEKKVKIALVKSNLLGKKEVELREAIKYIAPEWWDEETQVILNHNVQCKRHKDSNKEHSWIIFMGDFTGGALVFDDGTRFEEHYKWHKFDGHQYHWNEPHEGEKFSIVLYRSGAKQTKIQQIQAAQARKKQPDRAWEGAARSVLEAVAGAVAPDRDAGEWATELLRQREQELQEAVRALLKPVRARVESIPAPEV